MPVYAFRCEKCGTPEEKVFEVEKRKSEIKCGSCGGKSERDFCAEHDKSNTAPDAYSRPLISESMGVGPDQAKEATRRYAEAGCPTDFTPDGQCIIRSRSHRNKLLQLNGMRDNDAGYGDFAGNKG